jgi:hypothetical protein
LTLPKSAQFPSLVNRPSGSVRDCADFYFLAGVLAENSQPFDNQPPCIDDPKGLSI